MLPRAVASLAALLVVLTSPSALAYVARASSPDVGELGRDAWGIELDEAPILRCGDCGEGADAELVSAVYAQQRWWPLVLGMLVGVRQSPCAETPNGLQLWGYANGNPLRYTDPTGEAVCMMGKDPTECVRLFNSARAAAGSVPFYDPATMVQGTGGTFLNPNEFGGYNALVLMGDVTPANMSESGVPTGVMGVDEAATLLQGVGGAGIAQGEQVERLAGFFGQVWGGMSPEGIVAANQQAFGEGVSVLGGFSPLALVGITPQMRDWNNPATFGASNDLRKLLPPPGDFAAVGGTEQDYATWAGSVDALNGGRPGMYMLGVLGGAIATTATLVGGDEAPPSYSICDEAVASVALSPRDALLLRLGKRGTEFQRFRAQGYSFQAAVRLSAPYRGVGQHFIQQHLFKSAIQRVGGESTLLGRAIVAIRDNPLNVVSGRQMPTGRFYEYHARIHGQDTLFGGRTAQGMGILKKTKRPGSWTESWVASRVSPPLQPYGNLGYLWYGSPTALKITVGGAGVAGGAYWLSSGD